MARSLTLSNLIDKNKIASDVAWIFALEIDVVDPDTEAHVEYLRLCRNDEAITIGADTYQPMWFDVQISENEGELPEMTVSLQDQSRTVMYYLQNFRGGIGFGVKVMIVPIQQGNTTGTSEPDLEEKFRVISTTASSDNYIVQWRLGAENPLNILFPGRQQMRDRCSYEYLSVECGYNGPLGECKRTFVDCEAHSNEANFGGFPGIKEGR